MVWMMVSAVVVYVIALVFLFALLKLSGDVDAAGLRAERDAFGQSEAVAAEALQRIRAASAASKPRRDDKAGRTVAEC